MNKVLYFGSFNPVHYGHTGIARYVAAMPEVDAVVIIPSPHNPFKDTASLADPKVRLEYHMPEPLYTIRTLHSIKETEPDTNLILLIGGDNIESIRRWYRGSEILAEFEVWVYPRHGYDGENACREISAMIPS